MNIGNALKSTRKLSNLKQVEAATRIGISQAYLSQLESNSKDASPSLLKTIAGVYDVPFPFLIWSSIEEQDVKKEKLKLYRQLRPTIDALVNEIFPMSVKAK